MSGAWTKTGLASGSTITKGYLDNLEKGIALGITPQNTVDVMNYGAKGDGSDDRAAILSAISAVQARTSTNEPGGIVYFPPGNYGLSDAITVPNRIRLVGEHPYASRITYIGTAVLPYLFTFGTSGQIATFNGIERLWVNSATKVECAFRFYSPQEGSRVQSVISFSTTKGTLDLYSGYNTVDGGSNKFVIDSLWAYVDGASTATYGVRVDAGSGPMTIRDTTLQAGPNGRTAPNNSAGVVIAPSSKLLLENVNCEQWDAHTYNDGGSVTITMSTSSGCKYGYKSSTATDSRVWLTNAEYNDTTACVFDQAAGATIAYARSYTSEAYTYDQRQFTRNVWNYGAAGIMTNANTRTQMGYAIDADTDTSRFKIGTLVGGAWKVPAQVSTSGNLDVGAGYNGQHLQMGAYHLWVDSNGRLRVKSSAPTSDTDGSIVGSQS